MIRPLYTIKEIYRNKNIYIWNINRNSIDLFIDIAFKKINIQGFVTIQQEYVGQTYMNRPVVDIEQVKQDKDSIIFLADEVPLENLKGIEGIEAVYWSESQEINKELHQKKIIIYGTGEGAKALIESLTEENLEEALYCVTKKGEGSSLYNDKKIIEVGELKEYVDYAIIISTLKARYRKEILAELLDFEGVIYLKTQWIIEGSDVLNFIQNIDLALQRDRKIYLYSKKNLIAGLIEEVLNLYGIQINGYVGDAADDEQNIKDIHELSLDGTDDKLIIINEDFPDPKRLIKIRAIIEKEGFSLENQNYTSIRRYTVRAEWLLIRTEVYDPLLGCSRLNSEGKQNWNLYGREEKGGIRVLVLGNSASSEEFHPENWVSKLYHKFQADNIKVAIYNGAYPDDDIVSEILRLLRDGYILRPQVVISMSGVCNLQPKEAVNEFNVKKAINLIKELAPKQKYNSGFCSQETLYSFWSRNVNLLRVISNFYGAQFFGFLQPMNHTMKSMTLWEKACMKKMSLLLHPENMHSMRMIRAGILIL